MTDNPAERIGIYPGSFDPITLGHLDLIDRALHLFDRVIVAIAENPAKTPLFSVEERRSMIHESLDQLKIKPANNRIEVVKFSGLLAHLAMDRKATAILRGLRAVSDFEFEFQMALTNRSLAPEVEAVYLMPNAKYTYLSSSIIKDVARHGGDVSRFVPPLVAQRLSDRFGNSA
jgi:pantetheine-phosphate adenylyltransferase